MTTDLMEVEVALDPASASDEECRAAALEWVNTIRQEYNLSTLEELPVGQRFHPGDCVLARAVLGASDNSCSWTGGRRYTQGSDKGKCRLAREGKQVVHLLPPLVNEFVGRFDAGYYSDLIC